MARSSPAAPRSLGPRAPGPSSAWDCWRSRPDGARCQEEEGWRRNKGTRTAPSTPVPHRHATIRRGAPGSYLVCSTDRHRQMYKSIACVQGPAHEIRPFCGSAAPRRLWQAAAASAPAIRSLRRVADCIICVANCPAPSLAEPGQSAGRRAGAGGNRTAAAAAAAGAAAACSQRKRQTKRAYGNAVNNNPSFRPSRRRPIFPQRPPSAHLPASHLCKNTYIPTYAVPA